ncbi:hypothetical protein [Emcibacter sp.]|uniref:hypothetical protein n=1 Tax=Emcibacter sp. TaxID=1979954 RepID=UPI002AA6F14B|nr:hypothetical protein [Emcibacter sp.]
MSIRPPLQIGEVRKVDREDLPSQVLDIPEDFNPLADGVLMEHQKSWIADQSPLKLAEKGRRTGITWAEAQDDSLIAAASREAGGDNVYYIPDAKEKGLEFIGYCAHLLKFIDEHNYDIEEYFEEFPVTDDVGNETIERIAAYRIVCRSGFKIVGLSSRPAAIRGLQGVVVIDEVAFHNDPGQVIAACNALLIWGGRIRLISTHNGATNAFNELIKETLAGKWPYSLHHYTFDDAVKNGLYERVCLVRGWKATPQGKKEWYDRIRGSYGTRTEDMKQELDAVPADGTGQMLPLAWIEACQKQEHVAVRWEPPQPDFVDWPESARKADMQLWLQENVLPLIKETLPSERQTFLGEDFAMRQDRTAFAIGYVTQNLTRKMPFIVEMDKCPYDQQKQALFYIISNLSRFTYGILDANGNGMVLAQEARQKFGKSQIMELNANDAWYREFSQKLRTAFEDRTIEIPADSDVRDSLRLFQLINGVGKIPRDVRVKGTDGGKHHGDSAIAILNCYAASLQDVIPIEFSSTGEKRLDQYDYGEGTTERIAEDAGFGVVAGGNHYQGY